MSYREQCYETVSHKGQDGKRIKAQQIIKGVYQRKSETKLLPDGSGPDICYDITYKKDGKKIWEKVGWKSEGYSAELAAVVRSERMRTIRHEQELPKEKKKAPYFKDVAKKYIKWSKENKKSAKDDESRYTHHLGPEFDSKRLDEITPFDIERFKSRVAKGGRVARADDEGRRAAREPGLSPQTVRLCLALLRQMFNKAIAWGEYQGSNPVRDVKMPSPKNGRERFLTYEEAEALLTELKASSRIVHDIVLLALHTGMRQGEIFGLKAQHVKLSQGIIRIIDPKNGESRAAYMTEAVKEMLKLRIPEEPEAFIFTDREHKAKIEHLSNAFWNAINRLGFNRGVTDRRQKVTFHTLRHTHASWLALQGESLLTIAEALGHKTLVMVRRYSHLIPDEKKKAVLRLEQNFQKKVKKEYAE